MSVIAAANCCAVGLVAALDHALPQNTSETRALPRTGPPPSCSEVTFPSPPATSAALSAGPVVPATPPCGLLACESRLGMMESLPPTWIALCGHHLPGGTPGRPWYAEFHILISRALTGVGLRSSSSASSRAEPVARYPAPRAATNG